MEQFLHLCFLFLLPPRLPFYRPRQFCFAYFLLFPPNVLTHVCSPAPPVLTPELSKKKKKLSLLVGSSGPVFTGGDVATDLHFRRATG